MHHVVYYYGLDAEHWRSLARWSAAAAVFGFLKGLLWDWLRGLLLTLKQRIAGCYPEWHSIRLEFREQRVSDPAGSVQARIEHHLR